MMKYIFLTLIVTSLFMVSNVWGQNTMELGTGLYYGAAKSSDETDSIRYSLGKQLNIGFEFGKSTSTTFHTGLNIIQKSFKISNFSGTATNYQRWSSTYKVNYIQMPFLLKFKFGKENTLNGYLALGSSLSVAVGGKLNTLRESRTVDFWDSTVVYKSEEQYADGLSFSNGGIEEVSASFNKIDITLLTKFGLTFPVSSGYIFTEIGYDFGLLDIDRGKEDNEILKTRGFVLSVGYAFNLRKDSK